jgi:secondary thiamine-phosphate synthase enzyme
MRQRQHELTVGTRGQGLYEITREVVSWVRESGIRTGLCTVFLRHTSASVVIQENADPSARRDLEGWLNRLVRENDPHFTHTAEGPDDMPSHIKAALTASSLSLPVTDGAPALGTWQGVFVWEHRHAPHKRRVVLHLVGE